MLFMWVIHPSYQEHRASVTLFSSWLEQAAIMADYAAQYLIGVPASALTAKLQ